jgi:hypothetical protein
MFTVKLLKSNLFLKTGLHDIVKDTMTELLVIVTRVLRCGVVLHLVCMLHNSGLTINWLCCGNYNSNASPAAGNNLNKLRFAFGLLHPRINVASGTIPASCFRTRSVAHTVLLQENSGSRPYRSALGWAWIKLSLY